jgi:hypothetical protein
VLRPFREQNGEAGRQRWEVMHAHARRRWWHRPFSLGRKTTGWGGLAGPAKGRGLVVVGGSGPIRGKRGVGWPKWKERRAAARLNLEPGQNSKRDSF